MEADDYKQLAPIDHVLRRVEMYGATKSIQEYKSYVPNEDFTELSEVKMEYSMLLKKLIDEISTNAIDQARTNPKTVNNIYHLFDEETGAITIINDGTPIPLKMKKNLQGVSMPIPQFVTTEFNTSSNYNKSREVKTTGGCNGVGMKLTNVWSVLFITEVYCHTSNKLFQQTCTNNMRDISEYFMDSPKKFKGKKIIPKYIKSSYTAFKFIPDYKRMGYKKYSTELSNICTMLLRTQVMVASISNQPKPSIKKPSTISVYFNDTKCTIKSIKDIAIMNTKPTIEYIDEEGTVATDEESTKETVKKTMPMLEFILNDAGETPWHIVLTCDASKGKNQTHFAVVNGIYTSQGGTHVDIIRKQLTAYIKPKFNAMYNTKYNMAWDKKYMNYIQIYMNTIVILPEFDGQKKGALTTPEKVLKVDHIIGDTHLKKIMKLFIQPINDLVMLKSVTDDAKNSVDKSNKEHIGHYFKAAKLGSKATLCICEGVSAQGNLNTVIRQGKKGTTYTGTLALQGVIPNGLKESKAITNPETNILTLIRSSKLQDNKHIRAMYNALKLDPACKYECNRDGDIAFKKLNYGSLLIVTDQDVDGFNIQGLVLVLLSTFHPGLFDRGYVKILNTPVIIATIRKSKKIINKAFHSIQEYETWSKTAPTHTTKYIKGLASATDKDLLNILKHINSNTFEIKSLSNEDIKQLYIYYGPDPDLRKKCLSEPPKIHDIKFPERHGGGDADAPMYISTEEHLHVRVREYQCENLTRKLPNIMDGNLDAKRKMIATILKLPKGKDIKAAALAGKMIADMAYNHGDASASAGILNFAKIYYGAQNIAQITACGTYAGDRSNKVSGAARYVPVKGNSSILDVLYNSLDTELIEHVQVDGVKMEPKYYLPCVPLILLNTYSTISTGWSCSSYARDYKQVINNIKFLIKGKKIIKMDHDMSNFNGKVVHFNDYEWSVGTYKYNKKDNILTITELPIFVWTDIYVNGDEKQAKKFHDAYIKEKAEAKKADKDKKPKKAPSTAINKPLIYKKYVKEVVNNSHKDTFNKNMDINIDVYLEPGAYKTIQSEYSTDAFDGIEKYFGLNKSMKPLLNFINIDNTVKTYKSYEEVLLHWYELRKPYYSIRYNRERIMLELRILFLENLTRFTSPNNREEANAIVNTKNTSEKAISLLVKNKYQAFNVKCLNDPSGIPNDKLKKVILEENVTYSYILNLTCTQRLKEANEKRHVELQAYKDRLNYLNSQDKYFEGAEMWIEDLNAFQKAMEDGIKNNWNVNAGYEEVYE